MRKSLIDLDDARKQINEFAQYYNTKSLHSSMFYLTPDDFLNDRINEKLKKRNTKLQLAKKLVTRWKM
ncbi:MAG: integrase core domain-containing protein [Ignavibacteria bacterium]|nr:integrase core domain-containing protein [Ignavibacteria bacterium]